MSQAPAQLPLRVLIVEDSPDDAALMIRALRLAGLEPVATHVDSAPSMRAALKQEPWEIVLCDYSLPGFDGTAALDLMREFHSQTPLLIVSGTIGEEKAAELMRHGAADVLLKENIGSRLALVVRRELDAAEARRSAAESEQRFRDIVEVAGDWIWETGLDHRFTFFAGQSLDALAIRPETVLGKKRWELAGIDPEQDERWSRHKADLEARRPFRGFRYALAPPTGASLHMLVNGKPVFDEAGGFRGYRGTATDETAIVEARHRAERAEAQLRQSQKMEAIGNLTGGMAHDFNNLLGVIVGNLDLLRELRTDDSEADELVREALDAAVRGADLTRRLLAFARNQPLQPEQVDLNERVASIVKLLSRMLGEDVEVSLDLAKDIWPIVVDPAQLEASLTNLATNARDAMPRGGRLTIVTANRALDEDYAVTSPYVTPGDYAMIEVTDTGTGMTQEVVSRIFEPFYTTKGHEKGTGLGLSMVYGFMKQSGGHINVYSEPGVGTTFRLYLPRAGDDVVADIPLADDEMALGRGEVVLVVEDNSSMRRVVTRQLGELGYHVLETDNAASAIAVLAREHVDLLFTDIILPGDLNGLELARQARARWPQLRVVLTSGFPGRTRDGVDAPGRLLIKPYRKAELARALRDGLQG